MLRKVKCEKLERKSWLAWQIKCFYCLGWHESARFESFKLHIKHCGNCNLIREGRTQLTVINSQSMSGESQNGSFINATRWLGDVRHHSRQFLNRPIELIAAMLLSSISCLSSISINQKGKNCYFICLQPVVCYCLLVLTGAHQGKFMEVHISKNKL